MIPGPKSQALFEAEQEFISPGIQRLALLGKLAIQEARGAVLIDADGNRIIDFLASVAVASLGHSHPNFVRAVQQQVAKVSVGTFTSEPRLNLVKLIASLVPPPLKRTQLYSGGSEAVEAAIRLARSYTGKHEVLGFWGGFHGKTGGVLPLIGDEFKRGWGPLAGGFHLAPYADCTACPFKMTYSSCRVHCAAEFLRTQIRVATGGSLAAIIVEPIQGTAGNIVPPKEFLPIVRDIAHENGALLIADEMITGFGRTGKMFGFEHSGVVPDIMTIGKGMGCGFPITGLVSSPEIMAAKPYSNPSAASSSYGGFPLAAAAAHATIKTIVDDRLAENAAAVGAFMLERLQAMQSKYRFMKNARGVGLLLGFDFDLPKAETERLYVEALKRGLLAMMYGPRVRLNPPLVITKELAAEGLDILDGVLATVR